MQTSLRTAAISVLALALLVPAVANAAERTVSVSGSATRKVANDTAGLGFSVSLERKTRGAALRATSAQLRKVIAAVQTIPGVGEGDITTGRISVNKIYRDERPLYRASEGISVVLHQPAEAGNLVAAAIAAGATGTRGPNFFLGDPEAAYNAALAAAFDQAKVRAAALAAQAGATLGPAISIAEGGGIEASPYDAAAPTQKGACAAAPTPAPVTTTKRCAATPPVKPGTSTVTATVQVVFALQ
ncbi:MAG TPA: SIMPL domain-containing protein [Solirubrobacterales bacterium]|nr:SIMPL domain-containing protein [Solirubrobacterales bacterium]